VPPIALKALSLALAAVLGATGCRAGGSTARRMTEPPLAPPSGSAGTERALREAAEARAIAAEAGMPSLSVVLDDPRLARAREANDAGDAELAAEEVDRLRATAELDAVHACAWDFAAGHLYLSAEGGDPGAAALAFDRVVRAGDDAGAGCVLGDYARLREAQALLRIGHYTDASALLDALPADFAAHDEATLARADAAAANGNRALAVPIWRSILAAHPRGTRWVDVAFQLSTALVDGVDGSPEAHAQEALDLATRLAVDVPNIAEKLEVSDLRDRAARIAGRRAAPALTAEERARQAQAWLDASLPKRARETAQAVLRSVGRANKEHAPAACKAAIVASQATPHGKAEEAAEAWGEAIVRCEGDDAQVTALYQGAKASASAKRRSEAIARFDQVEKHFPKNRLADDARLRAAAVVQDEGDSARALAMLASIPDAYPEGDMRGEALFRVALAKLELGDLAGARETLDRLLATAPEPVGTSAAGRAEYFRARVAELAGDVEDAQARYAALVASQPFSYYMLLAYARLRAEDDGLARSTLQDAIAHEPVGPFCTHDHPELHTLAFDRFLRLLEVGEIDAARHEASEAGWTGEGAESEILWTLGFLYEEAGAPEVGHAPARTRLVDYRAHYPAGRWKVAWQVAFPRPWDPIVRRESETSGIPAPLTWAIMREESAFNPDAKSPVNALGLMQLMASTARLVAAGTAIPYDEPSLRRPEVSIALGARLLGQLRVSFPIHPALAVAAYNSGGTPVRRWLDRGARDIDVFVERIPYDETRAYVKRVLASEAAYAFLYAPGALGELVTSDPVVGAGSGTGVAPGTATDGGAGSARVTAATSR
jgi:soluble lytic murein transglycosylase